MAQAASQQSEERDATAAQGENKPAFLPHGKGVCEPVLELGRGWGERKKRHKWRYVPNI